MAVDMSVAAAAGTVEVAIGPAVAGMVEVVAGIIVVTVAVGELDPR